MHCESGLVIIILHYFNKLKNEANNLDYIAEIKKSFSEFIQE